MSENRRNQFIYLCAVIVIGVIHILWGREIFAFIGRTIIFAVVAGVLILALGDAIYCAIKNVSLKDSLVLKLLRDIKKKSEAKKEPEQAVYTPSKAEEEGVALDPGELPFSDVEVETGTTSYDPIADKEIGVVEEVKPKRGRKKTAD